MRPLSKFFWKKKKTLVSVRMFKSECACVYLRACKSTQRLNGEREGDGERIRVGSVGVRWPFNLESLM